MRVIEISIQNEYKKDQVWKPSNVRNKFCIWFERTICLSAHSRFFYNFIWTLQSNFKTSYKFWKSEQTDPFQPPLRAPNAPISVPFQHQKTATQFSTQTPWFQPQNPPNSAPISSPQPTHFKSLYRPYISFTHFKSFMFNT